jgi:4'-phosphopantetheinyl transferase
MKVGWWEQAQADVRAEDDWLGAWERSHLGGLRFPKRRADWRLGRWTAKHAVADYLDLSHDPGTLARIQIQPATSGAPEVFIDEPPGDISISLSHRDGIAACAVGAPGALLGCDLEVVEPHSDAFVADYFTAEEQAMTRQAPEPLRYALMALIWSAKESALKALRTGLRIDTRCVSVTIDNSCIAGLSSEPLSAHENSVAVPPAAPVWQPLRVSHADGQIFDGWWFRSGLVRTMVSIPATEAPEQFCSCHVQVERAFRPAL